MKKYLTMSFSTKEYKNKTSEQKNVINEALLIIDSLGIPIEAFSPRRLEKMALSFLAVIDVKNSSEWNKLKDITSHRSMKTREIIKWINENFNETISSGSYDDIRRKDLKWLFLRNIVISTYPTAATNDSRRGYALNADFSNLLKSYGTEFWEEELKKIKKIQIDIKTVSEKERNIGRLQVILPNEIAIKLSQGKHNELQIEIIEQFLTRFGFESEVLYIGDTSNKRLYIKEVGLEKINFFELNHDKLPDIIAYSESKNWLFLIEAVYSSGPISNERLEELKNLTKKCKAEIIYVSAFTNKKIFRKFVDNIAWETEVWIAEDPEHLIHFNGEKFLGPYSN